MGSDYLYPMSSGYNLLDLDNSFVKWEQLSPKIVARIKCANKQ